jgi:hypothetical protein
MKNLTILEGDCRRTLKTLPEGIVQCCITSPPYWGLRKYNGGDREIGQEETPEEYINHLLNVFRNVRRVLRDDWTCWVNIGETYDGERLGIPERFALAMQADGWIWRDTVIWCLSQSTILYAKTNQTVGPMSIHNLVRLDPSTVKLWTGEKWSQVLGWGATQSKQRPIRMKLRSGVVISCTQGHRWPLASGRVVRADELRVGDVLRSTQLPDEDGATCMPLDLAWFAGLYLAEGSMADDAIQIAGHTKEQKRHDRVHVIAEEYGGSCVTRYDGEATYQVVHGEILRGAIRHFVAGHNAHDKHLNPRCWRLPTAVLRAFLEGYLVGDGHWDESNKRWRLCFCRNVAWASDLRTLCARCGFSVTLLPALSFGFGRYHKSYRGEIRMQCSGHHNNKSRSQIVWMGKGIQGTFYDIGIADDPHLFALASGVLTHNCKPNPMPSSVCGWSWRRCQIKVKDQQYPKGKGITSGDAKGTNWGSFSDRFYKGTGAAEFKDCPGCPKCRPHNGLILCRDSWRTTAAHEPIFMFAKTSKYFTDSVGAREPAKGATVERNKYTRIIDDPDEQYAVKHNHEFVGLTANPRSVWDIPVGGSSLKHYAMFPPALPRKIIGIATPPRCCAACGGPYVRVVDHTTSSTRIPKTLSYITKSGRADGGGKRHGSFTNAQFKTVDTDNYQFHAGRNDFTRGAGSWNDAQFKTQGWLPSCDCGTTETKGSIVCDPFGGSATTGAEAIAMGRRAIMFELNPEYVKVMRQRLDQTCPLLVN